MTRGTQLATRRLSGVRGALGQTASIRTLLFIFVTALQGLVHVLAAVAPAQAADQAPAARAFLGELPGNVAEMREAILAAARSGDIAELRIAIEWNELKPDFGIEFSADPIAHLQHISADGKGREILALLITMLEMPPQRLAVGPDVENAGVFVWPYVSELPLDGLKPPEEVDALRLMPVGQLKILKEKKKWAWWRLAISADGTWLTFKKYD